MENIISNQILSIVFKNIQIYDSETMKLVVWVLIYDQNIDIWGRDFVTWASKQPLRSTTKVQPSNMLKTP